MLIIGDENGTIIECHSVTRAIVNLGNPHDPGRYPIRAEYFVALFEFAHCRPASRGGDWGRDIKALAPAHRTAVANQGTGSPDGALDDTRHF